MRAYIAYSRGAGPEEGAILVIANTLREAKPLAWGTLDLFDVDEYIDMAVIWMRGDHIMALADQTKLAAGEPHVIDSPAGCESCELWGYDVNPDGTCCGCDEWAGEELIRVLGEWRKTRRGNPGGCPKRAGASPAPTRDADGKDREAK